MRKFIGLFLALLLVIITWIQASPASAKTIRCEQVKNHEVCLVKIKRSAKKYWEYWASVSVDGEIRPMETYNCRDRVRLRRDFILVPFDRDVAGDLVCSLYVDKKTYRNRFNPPPFLSSED